MLVAKSTMCKRCHNYKINCSVKISKDTVDILHKKRKGGCQLRRIEAGRVGGGVRLGGIRVDVYGELKLL